MDTWCGRRNSFRLCFLFSSYTTPDRVDVHSMYRYTINETTCLRLVNDASTQNILLGLIALNLFRSPVFRKDTRHNNFSQKTHHNRVYSIPCYSRSILYTSFRWHIKPITVFSRAASTSTLLLRDFSIEHTGLLRGRTFLYIFIR